MSPNRSWPRPSKRVNTYSDPAPALNDNNSLGIVVP
jgi:hypothetical protein